MAKNNRDKDNIKLVIGGKSFKTSDVHRIYKLKNENSTVHGAGYKAHNINNSVNNIANKVNTQVDITKPATINIKATSTKTNSTMNLIKNKKDNTLSAPSSNTSSIHVSMAAGKYNSVKTNIDTSKVQTQSSKEIKSAVHNAEYKATRIEHSVQNLSNKINTQADTNKTLSTTITSNTNKAQTTNYTKNAIYVSMAAGKYDSVKSKVDVSKVQTESNKGIENTIHNAEYKESHIEHSVQNLSNKVNTQVATNREEVTIPGISPAINNSNIQSNNPIKNASAIHLSMAAGKYDNVKTQIDTSKVQTDTNRALLIIAIYNQIIQ